MKNDATQWTICKEPPQPEVIAVCNDPMSDFAKTLNNVSILGATYRIIISRDITRYPLLEKRFRLYRLFY